ncbi:hypothetical protein [Salipiger bermudensis]|uniref:hypothetical protein n=1 Tax=Salipiger bermudensis TaxID=344736 RepID=UPI001CD42BC9|nr:hypothetical protein [Salipiger bermudensis]MCA0964067.1 hypothetical protein [Salipiger bermudensis]
MSFMNFIGGAQTGHAREENTGIGLPAGTCTQAPRFRADAGAGRVRVFLPAAGVDDHEPVAGRRGPGDAARAFHTTIKTACTLP